MPAAIPAVIAGVGAIVKMAQSKKQERLANMVEVPTAALKESSTLPMAKQMMNARMPGAGNAEQNIFSNQANAAAGIDRNATSGAQALSMLAASQGQTNEAFNSLNQQEGNFKLNAFNNLSNLEQNDQYMSYQDQIRKRQEAINEKTSLRGSAMQNRASGWNELASTAYAAYQMKGDNNWGFGTGKAPTK